ncbi:MAG TPA: Mth938-like domain-containing protein [Burkholderiales bacterium]
MKLHFNQAAGRNAFTGYGAGYVLINGTRHEANVLVMPDSPVTEWEVQDPAHLRKEQISRLAGLDVEVLLIGTGAQLRFPPPGLLQPLATARIGVEIMGTPAACRTYNILMGEGRKVAAALIIRESGPMDEPACVRPSPR